MADKLTSTPTLTRQGDLTTLRHVTISSAANAYGAGTNTVYGKSNFPLGADSLPAHSPVTERQTCVDINTGIVYEWWNGAWH